MALHATRALRSRNYRLYFAGQGVSLIGTWITRIATSWLVYRLTNSELLLGVVSFVGQIPMLLLTPFAGVLVDRWNRHRILVVTQILSAVQSLALAILALTGVINVAELIVLQLFQGVIYAFDSPARQAFVIEMVESREDLPNAIALNSSIFNASRIIGPTIGGLMIAAIGEGWCFMADAISYIAVIVSLLMMRFQRADAERLPHAPMWEELGSGFRFTLGFAPVRALLVIVAVGSVMGMPYSVLMPAIASKVLHGGAHTLGILMTASGLGALLATLYMAARHTVVGLGRVITVSTVILSIGLIAFSFSHSLWLSIVVLPLVGAGVMMQAAAANTILQTIVSEELRGRVMALYSVAILGTQPIGSLLAGVFADRIGAQMTILIGAVICLLSAVWFGFKRPALAEQIRPIYIELGLLQTMTIEERT